jgi:hypothetical protein
MTPWKTKNKPYVSSESSFDGSMAVQGVDNFMANGGLLNLTLFTVVPIPHITT